VLPQTGSGNAGTSLFEWRRPQGGEPMLLGEILAEDNFFATKKEV
jgi:hypothetical protein